jgi:uncharacterized phage-associated protein
MMKVPATPKTEVLPMYMIPSNAEFINLKREKLIDGLRIIAWKHFLKNCTNKVDYSTKYEIFECDWKMQPILRKSYKEIKEEIESLGYSETQILTERSIYYTKRKTYRERTRNC